jgi:methenyltetrahydrofolate cyclohydrolase
MTPESLEGFLDRLASDSPAPGGGAAAALAAAASAALVAMVCRVTARRAAPSEAMTQVEREADALRTRLIDLVQEDADAFEAVLGARRLPTEQRPAAVRSTLVRATEIPLDIARAAARTLELCDALVARARASAVSDLGVAAALAVGALEGAALTARINLRDLDDPAFVLRTQAVLAKIVGAAVMARHRLMEIVAARTGIPA